MTNFRIILRNISDQNIHQHAPNSTIFLNFLGGSAKSYNVCTFIAFRKKIRYKKVHFSQFLKDPLQFIKITLPLLHQLF